MALPVRSCPGCLQHVGRQGKSPWFWVVNLWPAGTREGEHISGREHLHSSQGLGHNL